MKNTLKRIFANIYTHLIFYIALIEIVMDVSDTKIAVTLLIGIYLAIHDLIITIISYLNGGELTVIFEGEELK